jgi:MFS family permease
MEHGPNTDKKENNMAHSQGAGMRWRMIFLLMAFVALAHFNRISMSVAGAEQLIRPNFISETQMGVVYLAYLLPYTILMMPGGWFIDRFGPRSAWLVVGFGSAVFVALTGLTGLVWTHAFPLWAGLLVVRVLLGTTSAPLHPTGARLVYNWIPPSGANLVNGLIGGAACAGITSTYLVFGWLIDAFGWPGAFLVSSGVTLLLALVWMLTASDYPPDVMSDSSVLRSPVVRRRPASNEGIRARVESPIQEHRPPGAPDSRVTDTPPEPTREEGGAFSPQLPPVPHFLNLLANRSLLCLTLSYAAVGYFQYLFFYWAQYYFERVQQVPKETSRWYSSVLTLAMGVGMVLGGWLSDRALVRFGPRRGLAVIPILGLLLSAVVVVVGLRGLGASSILICFAIAMGAVGMSEGTFWTTSVLIGGSRGGTAAGIMNTGGNAGGLLAPILTPIISQFFGWQAGLGLASVVCLVGAVLWLPIDPSEHLEERAGAEEIPSRS